MHTFVIFTFCRFFIDNIVLIEDTLLTYLSLRPKVFIATTATKLLLV